MLYLHWPIIPNFFSFLLKDMIRYDNMVLRSSVDGIALLHTVLIESKYYNIMANK